ncbi:MAG: EAL domain-containing protein, partial [Gammaproteobacteria bacterium]|nr:EAL domain-containing protein [Gammaproteobacteria bacterium]
LLFLMVFTGTMFIGVNATRIYMQEQLTSHAQDAATSLGLSITHAVKSNDKATMDTMVNAIFDSGYYRDLTIKSMKDEVLIKKESPVRIENVPTWFVNAVPLESPLGTSIVMDQWSQIAQIEIHSHPGYAYIRLWNTALETLTWFGIGWLTAMLLVMLVLKITLLPLRRMEEQAISISNRDFVTVEKIPGTREFRRVVMAMNKMSDSIKTIVEQQIKLSERMRQEANQDSLTMLANRRSFNARMKQLLDSPDQFVFGALLLLQLPKFKKFNEQKGHESGDELLRNIAKQLTINTKFLSNPVIARLDGASFAILASDLTPQESEQLAEQIRQDLIRIHNINGEYAASNIGVVYYDRRKGDKHTVSELLSEADMAMRAAQKRGADCWHMYARENLGRDEIFTARKWKEILEKTIHSHGFTLHGQPVVSAKTGIAQQREIFARISDGDSHFVPANVFMPMVERWDLSVDLDMSIIESVIKHMKNRPTESICYSINISPSSIRSRRFADWLAKIIIESGIAPDRLHFESSENGAIIDLEALHAFAGKIRATGVAFSLDHFGTGFRSFGYLRDLKLYSIKIDGSYIHDIDKNKDNQFFVQSLVEIAHGLGIKVMAESVETPNEWEELKRIGVDNIQGYINGKPEPLK